MRCPHTMRVRTGTGLVVCADCLLVVEGDPVPCPVCDGTGSVSMHQTCGFCHREGRVGREYAAAVPWFSDSADSESEPETAWSEAAKTFFQNR